MQLRVALSDKSFTRSGPGHRATAISSGACSPSKRAVGGCTIAPKLCIRTDARGLRAAGGRADWLGASSDMIGQTVSHYRVVDKLGGGVIGLAYEARFGEV